MFKNTQYKFGETNEVSDMPLLIELTFQKNFKQITIFGYLKIKQLKIYFGHVSVVVLFGHYMKFYLFGCIQTIC